MKKLLRHWFWMVMFRYPKFRLCLTRIFLPAEERDVQIFGAPLRVNTRDQIGLWRAAQIAEENIIFRDEAASLLNLELLRGHGFELFDGRSLASVTESVREFSLLAVHRPRLPQNHGN